MKSGNRTRRKHYRIRQGATNGAKENGVSHGEEADAARTVRLAGGGQSRTGGGLVLYAACRAAAPVALISIATAAACITAAMRTALCTASAVRPCLRTTFYCEATLSPQRLMAEPARLSSSKSFLSRPGAPMLLMRSFAGLRPYSSYSTGWRNR